MKRTAAPWLKVREDLQREPIFEGRIDGPTPLYVERYLYQAVERTVAPLSFSGLITQFGPTPIREGERDHWRVVSLPSQSLLVPRGIPTHWHYTGTADFVCFYFISDSGSAGQRLTALAEARNELLSFSDPLVGAAALQLVNEIQKGSSGDEHFLTQLAEVMLEQTYRVLTSTDSRGINPRHVHFHRLQAVLNHIHAHLADDLSAESLARLAGVSLAHFRRIFQDATGTSVHRYILGLRIDKARRLLGTSAMPIARIAAECGFASQSHLTAHFRQVHAITPAQFRAQMSRR